MNNTVVRIGKDAAIIVDLSLNSKINGKQLNVLNIYVLTRCSKLKPIEKVFSILSICIHRFCPNKSTIASIYIVLKNRSNG